MRSKKEIGKIQNNKKSTPPKTHHDIHSSPATVTTSRRHATRHIPRVSSYTPTSIDPGFVEVGLVHPSPLPMAQTASVSSFPRHAFLQQMVQKEKQPMIATSNRHSDPHSASHSFKAARSRWKEFQTRSELGVTSCRPLWARHRLGRRVSTTSKKMQTLTLSCRRLERAPRASITKRTAVTIRHRIIDHRSTCPLADPLHARCYRR